ncbi:type II secretion system inner membrane protein GspF [Yersinia enterocolitica]|uniref:type II secretion system inner membrane protein GspF n=1 Tax=Yersinia enterocolitica TaxID=630 RepID=UPI002AC7BCBE|nr:type II secretion system inner membrane protein GspF [Yersinia enterocolitica]
MTQFNYRAIDQQGKNQRGQLKAESLKSARQQLREKNLVVISIAATRAKFRFNFPRDKIQGNDLVLLTRQLATLVGAALPIEEALSALAEQSEKPTQAALINNVRNKVLEGLPLAESLATFPHTFSHLFCAMIAAGEASGHLDKVLYRLADHAEQTQKIKSKITQAMLYPLILTLVAMGVITILLTAVVPQVVGQFVHMKQTLPLSTRVLIASSDAIREFGLWVLLLLLFVFAGIRYLLRSPTYRLKWHQRRLQLPVIGRVESGLNVARYMRTLSILNASAVPLLEAMHISASVLTNNHAHQKLQLAMERVREGSTISLALENTHLLSPMMRYMISSGEKSGELDLMLERAADIQDRLFFNQITLAMALFEPMLVISMASVVLFIIMSILQPILQLNSMMG